MPLESYLKKTDCSKIMYDIFISYRRSDGGREIARAIKSELDRLGYAVFLDFDELKDNVFDDRIISAIDSAPVFLFILSQNSLDRCVNEDDWVRKELEHAIGNKKHIVPVNPDNQFRTIPDGVPEGIREIIGRTQHSDVMLGSLFQASIRKMVDERIEPYVVKGFWKRYRKTIYTVSSLMALVLCSIFLYNWFRAGEIAKGDLAAYDRYLFEADAFMKNPDSLFLMEPCLHSADSIKEIYEGTRFMKSFGNRAEAMHERYQTAKDSLFNEYVSQYKFHYEKYLFEHDNDHKDKAVEYIEKALSVRYDESLESMKNILTK